jgi:hypothetical protein
MGMNPSRRAFSREKPPAFHEIILRKYDPSPSILMRISYFFAHQNTKKTILSTDCPFVEGLVSYMAFSS